MKKNRGNPAIIIILLLLGGLLLANSIIQTITPKPPVEITEFSIDDPEIKTGQSAVIYIKIKNVDLKTHSIKYKFTVSQRITLFSGAEMELSKENSDYVYTFTLDAAVPSVERVFTLVAKLEEGISKAEYPIKLSIFVDGNKINTDWKDLELTVTS